MSSVIQLSDRVEGRAMGAFAVINIRARRMGCKPHIALRAARLARREVLDRHKSAAKAIADMTAMLRLAVHDNRGHAA